MKAKKLVLCLLLSVAMVVTFIPLTAYAAYGEEHIVSFAGATDVSLVDDMYEIDLDHGTAYVSAGDFEYDYEEAGFVVHEGDTFGFGIDYDGDWYIESIECRPGEKDPLPLLEEDNWWEFDVPIAESEGEEYDDILIDVIFEEDTDNPDWPFTSFDEMKDSAQTITLDDPVAVDEEKLFKFVPSVTGTYMFSSYYDEEIESDAVARVLDENGEEIAWDDDSNGDLDFIIIFKAEKGKTYYLQTTNYESEAEWTVSLFESYITDVSFVGNGNHEVCESCESVGNYWDEPSFAEGDKIIITDDEGTKTIYTYVPTEDEDPYAFLDRNGARLSGRPELFVDENYAPVESNRGGSVKTVPATFEYMGKEINTSISVKFIYEHPDYGLEHHAAVAATCNAAGNAEYWQCDYCDRCFRDEDGINEFAANGWVIPAGHKWTHVVNGGGYLVNGSQYDQCTACGTIANSAVIPGWASYYVKGLKVAKGKGSLTVKWKKQGKKNLKKFNGYQIRYAMKSDMSDAKYKTAGKKAASKKIGKLKKKTTYYVQVRTYTKTGAGTFYSKWSGTKKVKTK